MIRLTRILIRPIFRGQGRNQEIISCICWFKWEQENLLLKFTDFYEDQSQNKHVSRRQLRVHTHLFRTLYCKFNLHNSSWFRSCLFPFFVPFFLAEVTLVYGYLLQKEQLGTHVPDRGDYQKVVIIGSVSSLFLMPSYPHCYFTKLNHRKMGPFQFYFSVFLGINRHQKQRYF